MTGKEYNNQFSEEELRNEIWKGIPNYEGYYQVSSLGRVRGLDREINKWNGKKIHKGKLLIPRRGTSKNSRFMVSLYCQDKEKKFYVSRLVLESFIGSCPEGMECCHNDGDIFNNKLENLRWDTPSNNQKDRIKHGTYQYGEKNASSKFTEKDIKLIRYYRDNQIYSRDELALMFKTRHCYIYEIEKRKVWKHI